MTQVMITLNQIKAHDPCDDGWETIVEAKGHLGYDTPWPLSDALDTNDLSDTLWSLRCLPEYDNLWRKYAVWCARQVTHLMTDQRSHDALDVAWRYSNGEASDSELDAAWAAARDVARDAAWAAARDVARDAAWAAAWAAARDVARDAAWDAAWAAAWDAARAAAWDAQSEKLRQILDAGEWIEGKEQPND